MKHEHHAHGDVGVWGARCGVSPRAAGAGVGTAEALTPAARTQRRGRGRSRLSPSRCLPWLRDGSYK